jgi:hypothetical protein
MQESAVEAVGRSAFENLRVTGGLIQAGLGFAGGGRHRGAIAAQPGLDRIDEASQEIALREFARPEAAAAGAMLGGLTEELATAGTASVAVMGRNMLRSAIANRAKRQANDAIRAAAASPVSGDSRAFNDLMADLPQANIYNGTADVSPAGAGRVNTAPTPESAATLETLENVPRWESTARGMKNKLLEGTGLSTTQKRLVDSGAVARSGFKLFPGQASGSNVVADMVETLPHVAEVFSPTVTHNARLLAEKTSRAVGLEAKDFGRDILGASRERVGGMFDTVEGAIGPMRIEASLASKLDEALNKPERELFDLAGSDQTGRDLMEIRSKLNQELAAERKVAAEGKRARQLEDTLEEFDNIIEQGIDDPAISKLYSDARQRWRVVRSIDNAVDPTTGDLSLKKLAASFDRNFQTEFKRKTLAGSDKLPADVADLLEYVRVARSFQSNLPNSGTATRNFLVKIATTPQVAVPIVGAGFFTGLVGE